MDLGRAFSKFDFTEVSLHVLAAHVAAVEASFFISSSQVPAPMRQLPVSATFLASSPAAAAGRGPTQAELPTQIVVESDDKQHYNNHGQHYSDHG